jgi:hypothetical protein
MENEKLNTEVLAGDGIEKKSKVRRIGKVILLVIGAIFAMAFLAVLLFVGYISLHKGDIPKVNDSALLLSGEIIPQEQNAYYDFKQAMKAIYWPADKAKTLTAMAGGSAWDQALAVEIVEKNQSALSFTYKGLQKSDFQLPELQGDPKSSIKIDAPLPELTDLKRLAQIQIIRSQLLLREGKTREAFEYAFDTINLGDKLQGENRVYFIQYLLGLSIKNMGLVNIQKMLPVGQLSAEDLKNFQLKIAAYGDTRKSLQEAMRMEYWMQNNLKEQTLDSAFRDSKGAEAAPPADGIMARFPYYYKPNETQKLFVDNFERLVNAVAKNCGEITVGAHFKLSGNVIFTENALGEIMADTMLTSLDGLSNKRCQADFDLFATRFMFATQAYKVANGIYPKTSDKLVPQYFEEMPVQFNGRQMKYDSQFGTVAISQ